MSVNEACWHGAFGKGWSIVARVGILAVKLAGHEAQLPEGAGGGDAGENLSRQLPGVISVQTGIQYRLSALCNHAKPSLRNQRK